MNKVHCVIALEEVSCDLLCFSDDYVVDLRQFWQWFDFARLQFDVCEIDRPSVLVFEAALFDEAFYCRIFFCALLGWRTERNLLLDRSLYSSFGQIAQFYLRLNASSWSMDTRKVKCIKVDLWFFLLRGGCRCGFGRC